MAIGHYTFMHSCAYASGVLKPSNHETFFNNNGYLNGNGYLAAREKVKSPSCVDLFQIN